MLIIKARYFAVSICLATAAIGGLGIAGYLVGSGPGGRSEAEMLFFGALAALFLLGAVALRALAAARAASGELDRIVDLARHNGVLPRARLARLGDLGERIGLVYLELAEAGERKTVRIKALSSLVASLLAFTEDPILVVELSGIVAGASAGYGKREGVPPAIPGRTRIEEIVPGLDFTGAREECNRTHGPVGASSSGEGEGEVLLYPIFGSSGEMSHIIADLSAKPRGSLPVAALAKPQQRDRMRGLLGLFGLSRRQE
jgi:hypothetical protein